MAQNLATKFSSVVDERFAKEMLTAAAVNNDYEFEGVQTVKVYSISTVAMGDYTRSGANRYGTPAELDDTVQTMTLTKDRAFTFTIDKGNAEDQVGAKNEGKALSRQINERVIPEIDTYRLAKLATEGTASTAAAITKSNAYSAFLDGTATLDDASVPDSGRICFCTADFYKFLKQDPSFIQASDLAQEMLVKGQIGEVDGVAIVKVPSSRMPENVAFILTHNVAMVSPIKLAEYKVHDNPPGINGKLVEGRIYYDAFVLDSKASAVYVHKTA